MSFNANINYFFSDFSCKHLVVARTGYLLCVQLVYDSVDLDLTEFFYSLLCRSDEPNGIISFRDFSALDEFLSSLESFCILDFSRSYALTDFEAFNIEQFLVQLTNSVVFLRDNY